VAHHLDDEEYWQFVRTIGAGGIDEPAGEWPNVWMSWIPIHTADCTLCGDRTEAGLEPYCVFNCPNKAMTFGDLDDPTSPVVKRIEDLRAKGFRIFQLPTWERTREEIYYAEK
jgi:Fe-S-cluster-containing dehydrogenase component